MKYTLSITCILLITILAGCTPVTNTQPTKGTETVSKTSTENDVATVESGIVVLELQNPHQLAGETLTFEVVIENITKAEGNIQEDTVEVNDNIEVNYRGTLDDGKEFDSSYTRNQTLPFTVGARQMISGFDTGVVGMKLSEEKTLVLSPEDAYGPATIQQAIPTAELRQFVGPDFEIAIGSVVTTAGGDATIVELQD